MIRNLIGKALYCVLQVLWKIDDKIKYSSIVQEYRNKNHPELKSTKDYKCT